MNIKEQVLSIAQVQELQELGFDVNKHASMCWIKYTSDEEPYEETYNLTVLDENCYEMSCLAPIPTLSIGDIMEILPKVIPILDTAKSSIFSVLKSYVLQTDMKTYLKYKYEDGNNLLVTIESTYFINILFDTLIWCIINKHIQCQ